MSRVVSAPPGGAGYTLPSTMTSVHGVPLLIWQPSNALVATSVPLSNPPIRHHWVVPGTTASALCSLSPLKIFTKSSRGCGAICGKSAARRCPNGSEAAGPGWTEGGLVRGPGRLGGRVPVDGAGATGVGGRSTFGGGRTGLFGGVLAATTGGF